MSQGDGRQLINLLENRTLFNDNIQPLPKYDRTGDAHYKSISALQKSIRGSDPDSALYWLAYMLNGGEDPLYLFRRLIRISVEDIGLTDPGCLPYIIASMQGFEKIGSPEGDLLLASSVVYLALSPKSNAIYKAFQAAQKEALATSHLPPPSIIRNNKSYQYDHNLEEGFSGQNYLPDGLKRSSYYQPIERGFERELKKRLIYFNRLRERVN
jgi:putative ATPase